MDLRSIRLIRFAWIVGVVSLVLASAASGTAVALDADQVILKNGDRITGHVVSTGAETLAFDTEAAGTIQIRRAAIERVVSGAKVSGMSSPAAVSRSMAMAGTEMLVRPGVQAPVVRQASAHCMVKSRPVADTWAFTLQGAPNKVVLGTQSEEQFGGALDVSLCEGSRRNTTNLTAAGSHARVYERGAPAIVVDVAGAELEQQHFFHSPQGAGVYGVGALFSNNSLGMAMQKSAGVGMLSPQFRHKALAYEFAADIRYLNQHLDHFSPALNYAGVRLKEQVHVQGGLFAWNEQGWIMPVLNDAHALQAYASFGPSVSLKPWLQLGLAEEESYLGNAPSPNRKNYFSSTLSLTLSGGSGSRTK